MTINSEIKLKKKITGYLFKNKYKSFNIKE